MPSQAVRPGGRQRKCAYCDRLFTKEEHLRRHQRSHTGERPFKCHKCDKSYARSDVLFRHLQSHPSSKEVNQAADISKKQNLDKKDGLLIDTMAIKDGTKSRDVEAPMAYSEPPLAESPTADVPTIALNSLIPHILPVTASSDISTFFPQSLRDESVTDRIIYSAADPHIPHVDLPDDRNEDIHMEGHNFDQGENLFSHTSTIGMNYDSVSGPARTRTDIVQSPSQCIMEIGTTPSLEHLGSYVESLPDQAQFFIFEPLDIQFNDRLLPQVLRADNEGHFQDDSESVASPRHIPSPENYGLNHNMMNYLDWDLEALIPNVEESKADHPAAVSEERTKRIRLLWSRQRPKPAEPLIKILWKSVINHQADNIFTTPQALSRDFADTPGTSRCTMDEECRLRLVRYCKELDELYRPSPTHEKEWTPQSSESSSDTSEVSLPLLEILDSSLDFFFQFFHQTLPFIHKSTFDPRNTPSSLLLAMCLVGMSYLDRMRHRAFVRMYLKRMLRSCLHQTTSQVLNESEPPELLATLASTLIVVYLALGFRDELDDCQAYILCTQMLSMVDKKGIFAADKGDDPVLLLRQGPSDPDNFWKIWARVESVKRLICCFVALDMAYARLMNTAGVIEIDKMKLHLPCEDALFDASDAASFVHETKQGARLTMPRMNIRNLHLVSMPSLNDTSAQMLLRALYLGVIAARTKLSSEDSYSSDIHSVSPMEALAADSNVKEIISSVLLLPTTHASVFKSRNRMNVLGWNYLCILLTADVDLLEIASGRDGPEAASTAQVQVAKWSRSASSRRAILHAVQIFDILDSSRIRESHIMRPDLVLFVSALVMSQYILTVRCPGARLDYPPFELLRSIDWTIVRNEGFKTPVQDDPSSIALMNGGKPLASSDVALNFLQYGGPISFGGELQSHGNVSARKILRKFAHVMDGFGTWDGSGYCQLLKMMCDSLAEDV